MRSRPNNALIIALYRPVHVTVVVQSRVLSCVYVAGLRDKIAKLLVGLNEAKLDVLVLHGFRPIA